MNYKISAFFFVAFTDILLFFLLLDWLRLQVTSNHNLLAIKFETRFKFSLSFDNHSVPSARLCIVPRTKSFAINNLLQILSCFGQGILTVVLNI